MAGFLMPELSGASVVVSALEELDRSALDEIDQAMLLGDPTGPDS